MEIVEIIMERLGKDGKAARLASKINRRKGPSEYGHQATHMLRTQPRKIRLIMSVKNGWQKTMSKQNAMLSRQQNSCAHSTGPHSSLPMR